MSAPKCHAVVCISPMYCGIWGCQRSSSSNNESNNAAGQVSESPNRQRLGEATAAPTPAASSEQQEYERKRDAHKAADQAAGNRSGDSGLTGSAPVPAAPKPSATPRTDMALARCENDGYDPVMEFIALAYVLERELSQACLERDSARFAHLVLSSRSPSEREKS